jgi:hypothetical protein
MLDVDKFAPAIAWPIHLTAYHRKTNTVRCGSWTLRTYYPSGCTYKIIKKNFWRGSKRTLKSRSNLQTRNVDGSFKYRKKMASTSMRMDLPKLKTIQIDVLCVSRGPMMLLIITQQYDYKQMAKFLPFSATIVNMFPNIETMKTNRYVSLSNIFTFPR